MSVVTNPSTTRVTNVDKMTFSTETMEALSSNWNFEKRSMAVCAARNKLK